MKWSLYILGAGLFLMTNVTSGKTGSAPTCYPVLRSASAVSSTSIRVTWLPLRESKCRLNGVLRGYKVAYRLKRRGSRMMYKKVSGNRNTTVVTGLDKHSVYIFRVLAFTVKDGPLSIAIIERTREDAPTCYPALRSASAVSSTSIHVTWLPLRESKQCRLNGVLRGYTVAYRLHRHGSRMMYMNVRPSRTSTVVTGLDKYTLYIFQVLAYTVKDGPLSDKIIGRTLEDAPTCYPALRSASAVSSTSIRVTWLPLRESKRCRLYGVLRGYKVAYRLKRHGRRMMYKKVSGNRTTTVVTGLDKHSVYIFRVLAYTVKDGLLSIAIIKRTREDAPVGPPQRVAVTKINITSYRVTWKPVRNGLTNGIITKYEVLLILTKLLTKTYNSKNAFHVSSKTVLQYVFHDLALCAQYTVNVRAFTREGFGPYSRAVLILTQSKGLVLQKT